jgi:hypothetical protein
MTEPPTRPSLLSDAYGRLRRVLLSMPWWIVRYRHQGEFAPIAVAFEGLLSRLPAYTEVVVAARKESEHGLRAWLGALPGERPLRIVTVPDDLTLTCWAQDACLVVRTDGGRARLIAPADFGRQDDARVLARVAADLGLPHPTSPLAFQGGNVLVADDFWLIGEDSISETVEEGLAQDRPSAIKAFRTWLDAGRTLHVIGTDLPLGAQESRSMDVPEGAPGDAWTEIVRRGSLEGSRQPIFDLDTFVSLAGRGADGRHRILVGDPRMAAELMGAPLPDHAHAESFDDIARQCAALGFHVIRNPLPLVFHDDAPARVRLWYFASSNNVLTEIDGEARNVWIPTYGSDARPALRRTDQRNLEIWRDLGFTTVALPGFDALARDLGAARCLCKSLER